MKGRTFKTLTKGAARLLDYQGSLSKAGRDATTSSVEKSALTLKKNNNGVMRNMAEAMPGIIRKMAHKRSTGGQFLVTVRSKDTGFVSQFKISVKHGKTFDVTADSIKVRDRKKILEDIIRKIETR